MCSAGGAEDEQSDLPLRTIALLSGRKQMNLHKQRPREENHDYKTQKQANRAYVITQNTATAQWKDRSDYQH